MEVKIAEKTEYYEELAASSQKRGPESAAAWTRRGLGPAGSQKAKGGLGIAKEEAAGSQVPCQPWQLNETLSQTTSKRAG